MSSAAAFDAVAARYDREFGRNPVGLLFRHVFQRRLAALFAPGATVLDLGCGTGEDALFLAGRGVRVHAIDASGEMLAALRSKACARGIGADKLTLERRRAEDVAGAGPGFDGAYSDFGALNCAELAAVGDGLARALKPGAPLLLSLMGRRGLPAMVQRGLTGRGQARGRGEQPRVGGVPVATLYPTPDEARRALGGAWRWIGCFALGVLMPGPEQAAWVSRHPLLFGALAAAESVVRGWPLLRGLGDHVVLEGVRR